MKLTKLLFVMALGLFVVACGTKDEVAPTITITSPTAGTTLTAGDVFKLEASVSDNEMLSQITVSDGTATTTISEFDTETSHAVRFDVTVNEDSPAGTLEIAITAIDAEGNSTTQTASVVVEEKVAGCQPVASCMADGKTTIVVVTPEGTPADAQIEMVGSFNGWPGELDANFVLTKNEDNCYCIAVDIEEGSEFKFRRDGDWGKVEKDAAGEEIDNRMFTADAGGVIMVNIEKWADL